MTNILHFTKYTQARLDSGDLRDPMEPREMQALSDSLAFQATQDSLASKVSQDLQALQVLLVLLALQEA